MAGSAQMLLMDQDACGADTRWGCGSHGGPVHFVMGIPFEGGGVGNRFFHAERCCPCPSCLNLIAVVPNAFSRGLAREQAARVARAAS